VDALAAQRREMLSGVDHRRQVGEALNARNSDLAQPRRQRVWLLHQLTWPRWPRAAVDEA
jgi:hypothetical protein